MHGHEKSDPGVVAMKPANGAGKPGTEWVERRAGAEGNASRQATHRAQNRGSVAQALERVRQCRRTARALPSHTQGGSRMRESRTYGSVRGAPSNGRPYRDPAFAGHDAGESILSTVGLRPEDPAQRRRWPQPNKSDAQRRHAAVVS